MRKISEATEKQIIELARKGKSFRQIAKDVTHEYFIHGSMITKSVSLGLISKVLKKLK